MKIGQINEAVTPPATQKPNKSTPLPFSASLENALSRKISGGADGGRTSALREPQSPAIDQPGISASDVVGKTDRLLALLESYATGLENPEATLKDLASMVTMMKDEAGQLMASTGSYTGGENDINGIAAKAALTANVEYIKFHRGDYV